MKMESQNSSDQRMNGDLFIEPRLIKFSKAHKTTEKCVYYNVACKFPEELERGSLENGEIRNSGLRSIVGSLWQVLLGLWAKICVVIIFGPEEAWRRPLYVNNKVCKRSGCRKQYRHRGLVTSRNNSQLAVKLLSSTRIKMKMLSWLSSGRVHYCPRGSSLFTRRFWNIVVTDEVDYIVASETT